MAKEFKDLSPSRQSATKTVFATFKMLKEAGGQLPGREVIEKLRKTLKFNDWEKENYEKTGYVRWESMLHFYTVDCQKAGYLRKDKGIWYLTEEGEKAISKGEIELLDSATKAYRKWAADRKKVTENKIAENESPDIEESQTEIQKAKLIHLEIQATAGIKEAIKDKDPYEFQKLVAALLRAMKYYTVFISPKGKDGGIDIIAYNDPLGATTPRLKVQVKHKPDTSVPVSEIRELTAVLNKDGDIGLFVTSGSFTNESEKTAREIHKQIKLLDIDDFMSLWQEFYGNLTDEDKNMLPLKPIYFLGSNE
jgi:restriction system protein